MIINEKIQEDENSEDSSEEGKQQDNYDPPI